MVPASVTTNALLTRSERIRTSTLNITPIKIKKDRLLHDRWQVANKKTCVFTHSYYYGRLSCRLSLFVISSTTAAR
jgi:hypothetical protein